MRDPEYGGRGSQSWDYRDADYDAPAYRDIRHPKAPRASRYPDAGSGYREQAQRGPGYSGGHYPETGYSDRRPPAGHRESGHQEHLDRNAGYAGPGSAPRAQPPARYLGLGRGDPRSATRQERYGDLRYATRPESSVAVASPPADAPAATGRRAAKSKGFRPDIQGMRALAVSMVVIYHLFPSLLPGGYAGVDVFFVISGFLITGHMRREYAKSGTIALVDFWGRRAKRLMPASALVLAVTWVVSLKVLPSTQLADVATQIRASALYFQNWQLASEAVNYLTENNAPTPVQHFWSLSVEEQFYIIWPLLFVIAAIVIRLTRKSGGQETHRADGRARSDPSRVRGHVLVGCLTTVLVLASLAYSYYETKANPSAAYFVTTTRIWELGFGGLLALAPEGLAGRLGRQGWLSWVGLALVIASLFTLRASTPFPGFAALLPVVGAVLLIACGSADGRYGTARLMSLAPLVWIGGISYSLYLWHFPVFTLWAAWHGTKTGYVAGAGLVLVAVLLSWATKVLVEDKVRQAKFLDKRQWRSLSTALVAVLPVALVTVFLATQAGPWNGKLGPEYPGAAVLAGTAPNPAPKSVLPPLSLGNMAMSPQYWQDGCLVDEQSPKPKACVYGDTTDPKLTVALVGDSIAGNWFPALDTIAKERHWKLVTEIHGDCTWTSTLLWLENINGPYTACQAWGKAVLNDLVTTIHPNVVITSAREAPDTPDHHTGGPAARAEVGAGEADYWKQLEAHGISVIALTEGPEIPFAEHDCVVKHTTDYAACDEPTAKAITKDPPSTYAAAKMGGKVPVIDMNSLICGPQVCAPVVGNVLVFFDQHHMTAAYSQTLAPFLLPKLLAASTLLRGTT